MEYPLISEYKEAILSAEDNFNELSSLRPVLDSHGDPVMSSGNFAVVFKMRDESDGKLYAVKCFIKDQAGRDESYRKIADELEEISSSYILPLRYLENELFVDSAQCEREEFPVVVMEWVEGETLDAYLNRNLNDKYELDMLGYRFNRMAAWLLAQPFAHGDLKPDNILVRKDGSLVLVDYDGMFVPSMKGEKAREIGSPDYRHPARTDTDFDEHIDDFSIAVIALSLKAIALNPELKPSSSDSLLLNENDYRYPSDSVSLSEIQKLSSDSRISVLLGIFYISLAKNSLDSVSFRLFMTDKPKHQKKVLDGINLQIEKLDTSCSTKDIEEGIEDEFGVVYSKDGKRLLRCKSKSLIEYWIKQGTQILCDGAFNWCKSIQHIHIPESLISIGKSTFWGCECLQKLTIPGSVISIGEAAFWGCDALRIKLSNNSSLKLINNLLIDSYGRLIWCCNDVDEVVIPNDVTSIAEFAFYYRMSLRSISIPNSVVSIGQCAFQGCKSLSYIHIPNSITNIEFSAFMECSSIKNIIIPNKIEVLTEQVFFGCSSLETIEIPNSVISIGDRAFKDCISLKYIDIPNSVITIGEFAFYGCKSLAKVNISNSAKYVGDQVFPKNCLVSCI